MSKQRTIYELPASRIDYCVIHEFVLDADSSDLFTESVTLEAKLKRDRNNVAEAVAALANTDGGIVLVGISEEARGTDRIVGVRQKDHDSLVLSLHSLIPDAMPEVIPVAIPDSDRLIILLRINADEVLHPVMVAGRILYRVPGASVPADRVRVLHLVERDRHGRRDTHYRGPGASIRDGSRHEIWPGDMANCDAGLRILSGIRLPRRVLRRAWFPRFVKDNLTDALNRDHLADVILDEVLDEDVNKKGSNPWKIIKESGTWFTIQAQADRWRDDLHIVKAQTSAHICINGRDLSALVGVRWRGPDPLTKFDTHPLTQHDVIRGLKVIRATAQAVVTVLRTVAESLNASEPIETRQWEGWIAAGPYPANISAEGEIQRDPSDGRQIGWLPPAQTPSLDSMDISDLAEDWVDYLMAEKGKSVIMDD